MTDEQYVLFALTRKWCRERHDQLLGAHILTTLESSPPNREKRSIRLLLEGEHRMAQAIIWESGEAEFEYAEIESGHVRREHREIGSPEELEEALNVINAWLGKE